MDLSVKLGVAGGTEEFVVPGLCSLLCQGLLAKGANEAMWVTLPAHYGKSVAIDGLVAVSADGPLA